MHSVTEKNMIRNLVVLPQIAHADLKPGQRVVTCGGFEEPDQGKALQAEYEENLVEFSDSYYSLHEESDTLIWHHANKCFEKKITTFSPETDVYHIGLPLLSKLENKEIFTQIDMLSHENIYH